MIYKNLKLLYAEDEKDLREAMKSLIGDEMKEFLCAKDGIEAYEMYKLHKPEIIIFDVNMPYMNGLEVAQKIRETDHDTRIIVITAFSELETLADTTQLELTKYLTKPFSGKDFLEALNLAAHEIDNLKVV
ncbi:MAG: response regulator [Arcobacteraceae bacterium]|nr:response regulator [Arcobacteraceae bacterium]